jgi:nitrogen-specific signal transduction histidine kinase
MLLPAANISNETAMSIAECQKTLIDAFPEAILLVEKHGRILYGNRAALDLFGGTLDQLATRDFSSLITDDRSKLELYLRESARAAQFHIGSFHLKSNSSEPIACRCDCALLSSTGENMLVIRLTPRTTASTPFIALNEQI